MVGTGLSPIHTERAGTTRQIELAVANGSVHTGRKEHQRKCQQIYVLVSSVWIEPEMRMFAWEHHSSDAPLATAPTLLLRVLWMNMLKSCVNHVTIALWPGL